MTNGVAASDIIRSMMRAGFSRDDVYDLLTEAGLHGEQVQLLIDRVAAEFHEVEMQPRPSRIAIEVRRLFQEAVEDLRHEIFSRADLFALQQEVIKTEVEKLRQMVAGLQPITRSRKLRRGK
ncbi:MAG: hypothetical protein ABH852_04175 [Methanobacteriota archaeon]